MMTVMMTMQSDVEVRREEGESWATRLKRKKKDRKRVA